MCVICAIFLFFPLFLPFVDVYEMCESNRIESVEIIMFIAHPLSLHTLSTADIHIDTLEKIHSYYCCCKTIFRFDIWTRIILCYMNMNISSMFVFVPLIFLATNPRKSKKLSKYSSANE